MFLDFLKVEGSFEEQAKQYLIKVMQDAQWIQDNLRHFIDFQIERVRYGEVSKDIWSIFVDFYPRLFSLQNLLL